MATFSRTDLEAFAIANPAYTNATVTFYQVNVETGARLDTLIDLFDDITGTSRLANPYTLDSNGKFLSPVYFEQPFIAVIGDSEVPSHSTGVIMPNNTGFAGDWEANATYAPGVVVRDGPSGANTRNLYIATTLHQSSANFTTDLANGNWTVVLDVSELYASAATVSVADAIPWVTAEELGLKGDGTTDDGQALSDAIEFWSLKGGAVFELRAAVDNAPFYVNTTVRLASNVKLIFHSKVYLGEDGRFRARGSERETNDGSSYLRTNASAGATQIDLSYGGGPTAGLYTIGQYIVLRGENDASGEAINTPDRVHITGVDGSNNRLTFTPALENSYQVSYPDSAYTPDNSTGIDSTTITPLVGALLTANALAGTNAITVSPALSASFKAGDWVLVQDEQLVSGAYAEATSSDNIFKSEMVQILAVNTGTGVITVDRMLHHSYTTANNSGIAVIDVVENCGIYNLEIYAAYTTEPPRSNVYQVELAYTVNSRLENVRVKGRWDADGNLISWKSQSFRLYHAANNVVIGCGAENPGYTGAGLGYGMSIYSANDNQIIGFYGAGCRHTMLLFKGACGNQISNLVSLNAMLSDVDFHGAGETENTITDIYCVIGSGAADDGSTGKACVKFGNPTHIAGCHRNVVTGLRAFNYVATGFSTRAVEFFPLSTGNIVTDLVARGLNRGIYAKDLSISSAAGQTRKSQYNVVRGAIIEKCDDYGVELNSRASATPAPGRCVDGYILEDITLRECAYGMYFRQCNDIKVFNYTNERSNHPGGGSTTDEHAIKIDDVTGFVWRGGNVYATKRGFYAKDSPSFIVQDVNFHALSTGKIFTDAAGNTAYNWLDNDYIDFGVTMSFDQVSTPEEIRHRRQACSTTTVGVTGSTTTAIGVSGSEPTISEGDEFLTKTYTPKNPCGTLDIEVWLPGVYTSAADNVVITLWDGTDFLTASVVRVPTSGASNATSMYLRGQVSFASNAARTISARIGPKTGTTTVTYGDRFGSLQAQRLIINEHNPRFS